MDNLAAYNAKVHTVLWKMIVCISPILFVKLRTSQSNADSFLSGSKVTFSTPYQVYAALSGSSPFERGEMAISWRHSSSPRRARWDFLKMTSQMFYQAPVHHLLQVTPPVFLSKGQTRRRREDECRFHVLSYSWAVLGYAGICTQQPQQAGSSLW